MTLLSRELRSPIDGHCGLVGSSSAAGICSSMLWTVGVGVGGWDEPPTLSSSASLSFTSDLFSSLQKIGKTKVNNNYCFPILDQSSLSTTVMHHFWWFKLLLCWLCWFFSCLAFDFLAFAIVKELHFHAFLEIDCKAGLTNAFLNSLLMHHESNTSTYQNLTSAHSSNFSAICQLLSLFSP